MSDEHTPTTPAWIENTALSAPAVLGAAAGLLLGDMMNRDSRRAVGIGLGIIGLAMVVPLAVGSVRGLVTGPRSKFGVRRRIQGIRDAGMGESDYDVDAELREQGVI